MKRIIYFGGDGQITDRKTGRTVNPVAARAGLYPKYYRRKIKDDEGNVIGYEKVKRIGMRTREGNVDYDPDKLHGQVIRSAYRSANTIRRRGEKGVRIASDVSDVVRGKPRKKDRAGREKKREWEKPYFRNAVISTAGAGAILGGAAYLSKNPRARARIRLYRGKVARAVNKRVPDWIPRPHFSDGRRLIRFAQEQTPGQQVASGGSMAGIAVGAYLGRRKAKKGELDALAAYNRARREAEMPEVHINSKHGKRIMKGHRTIGTVGGAVNGAIIGGLAGAGAGYAVDAARALRRRRERQQARSVQMNALGQIIYFARGQRFYHGPHEPIRMSTAKKVVAEVKKKQGRIHRDGLNSAYYPDMGKDHRAKGFLRGQAQASMRSEKVGVGVGKTKKSPPGFEGDDWLAFPPDMVQPGLSRRQALVHEAGHAKTARHNKKLVRKIAHGKYKNTGEFARDIVRDERKANQAGIKMLRRAGASEGEVAGYRRAMLHRNSTFKHAKRHYVSDQLARKGIGGSAKYSDVKKILKNSDVRGIGFGVPRSYRTNRLIQFAKDDVYITDKSGRVVLRATDARGNSARIHSEASRPRNRRGKQWHEKLDNERKIRNAVAGGGALAALASGIGLGFRIAKKRGYIRSSPQQGPGLTPKQRLQEVAGKIKLRGQKIKLRQKGPVAPQGQPPAPEPEFKKVIRRKREGS